MRDDKHTCPVWAGHLLICPLRRLVHDPYRLLSPYVREGMQVLDLGPGMGFFSLPIAEMVGESGRVFCVDIQEKMLKALVRRAEKRGVGHRIVPVLISDSDERFPVPDEIRFEFALAFAVLHEVTDVEKVMREIHMRMLPGGVLYYAEPKGHVKRQDFENTLAIMQRLGFSVRERPRVFRSMTAVLVKNE